MYVGCMCVYMCMYVRKYTYMGTRTSVHAHVDSEAGTGGPFFLQVHLPL